MSTQQMPVEDLPPGSLRIGTSGCPPGRTPHQSRRARCPASRSGVRENARRMDGGLEGTRRGPDDEPRGIVVIAHPVPTHGGEMRNPLVAGIARACAERGWYALRFNFRGVGASDGTWTGGPRGAEGRRAPPAPAPGLASDMPPRLLRP